LALGRGVVVWTPACLLAAALLWREREASRGEWRWTPKRVFLAAFAVYLSTFRWRGGDDTPTSLVPLAVLQHGTLTLDAVIDPWLTGKTGDFTVTYGGHYLSVFPVAAALLALPFYALPVLAKAPITLQLLHNLSKVSASAITAASAAFFFAAASRRASPGWAARLTLVYALGTWAFSVSSQALWQHGPASLGFAIGLWGLCSKGLLADAAAGFGFAFAAASRPDSVFIGLGAAGYLLARELRRAPGAALGAAVPAAFLAWYWLHYTGRLRPPEAGFQSGAFVSFQPAAFLGLLASPTRGLLWFCPAALFGVWAGLRRGRHPAGPWLLAGTLATLVFLSHFLNWVGGMTFGGRYWAGASLVLLFLCADAEEAVARNKPLRQAFGAAAAASILVHALGAYLNWPGSFEFPFEHAHVWDWALHPWAHLLSPSGGLGGLSVAGRSAAFLAATAGAARLARALAPVQGQVVAREGQRVGHREEAGELSRRPRP
jgi:hypothetical protein